MTDKEIIRAAMKSVNCSQEQLAKSMGLSSQSAIATRLLSRGKRMWIDTFVKYLDVLGYKVVVVSKSPTLNKNKWELDCDENNSVGTETLSANRVEREEALNDDVKSSNSFAEWIEPTSPLRTSTGRRKLPKGVEK